PRGAARVDVRVESDAELQMTRGRDRLTRRLSAVLATTALVAAGIGTASAPAAAAAPLAGTEVLDLPFDGTLADASDHGNPVAVRRGTERYVPGVAGSAFQFDGATALDLGTGAHLQPEDLTLSFWFKPSEPMGTGEQVIAWSKTVYNSDGWYLASENNNRPLAL